MRAGDLRYKVSLQRSTSTPNSFGESVPTWATFAEVWASRSPVSGRESLAEDQVIAAALYRFRMYYRSDLDATCRILCDGLTYNIKAPPTEIGWREGVDVIAEVVNP